MMPLPAFELARPRSLDEALSLLHDAGADARVLAGGTDLLVHLKQGITRPRLLVSVRALQELRGIHLDRDGALCIGGGEALELVARSDLVRAHAPALAEACARVAHPQARAMGTLAGNLCLDVRCRYVDRSAPWRAALGGCIKTGAARCHVVPEGRRCVAALSGDTIAPLVALDADVELAGTRGWRRVPVATLRSADGCTPTTLLPGELVVRVRVPAGPLGRRSAYRKWAARRAIDFPLVSVALVCEPDDRGGIARLRIAVGALAARPRVISGLDQYRGQRLGASLARAVAADVFRQCVPLPNILYDPEHRRHVLAVLVRRELEAFAASFAVAPFPAPCRDTRAS
jgi:4-hydroxybenzoyl-CoA reductase subunit beta